GLGHRAHRGQTGRARRPLRPGGAADPAARHLRADEVGDRSRPQGRPGRAAPRRPGREDEDPGVPARQEELMTRQPPVVERVGARAYRVPTPGPEADGTLAWDATTIVVVRVDAGGVPGLGWTYADTACVPLIEEKLAS